MTQTARRAQLATPEQHTTDHFGRRQLDPSSEAHTMIRCAATDKCHSTGLIGQVSKAGSDLQHVLSTNTRTHTKGAEYFPILTYDVTNARGSKNGTNGMM